MQVLSNILESNREFLYRTQLRSLRNLYWLPLEIVDLTINTIEIDTIYKIFIHSWIKECKDPNDVLYYVLPDRDFLDMYKNCYDSNHNLTTIGQELHDDAATLVLNQG